MIVELTFGYNYVVRTPAGDSLEGGGQMTIEVEHEQVLNQRELYLVAFDMVLEQLEAVWGDSGPDITIGLKGLQWHG